MCNCEGLEYVLWNEIGLGQNWSKALGGWDEVVSGPKGGLLKSLFVWTHNLQMHQYKAATCLYLFI